MHKTHPNMQTHSKQSLIIGGDAALEGARYCIEETKIYKKEIDFFRNKMKKNRRGREYVHVRRRYREKGKKTLWLMKKR